MKLGLMGAALAALVISACAPTMEGGSGGVAPMPAPGSIISAQRLSDGIRTISADDFQGRYPGTVGEEKTLAWLQGQYEAMGYEPGGPNGQWLQPVHLRRYTPNAPATASWSAAGQSHALTNGTDILLRSVSNDGKANVQGAGVVFAGYGISAPERNWDDYAGLDVRGKVVIVVAGEPEEGAAGETFNGAYPTTYEAGSYKTDEAFRRGAIGVLTLNPAQPTDQAWTRAARANDRQRTQTPGGHEMEFTGAINAPVFEALMRAGGQDPAVASTVASGRFKAVALNGVTLSATTSETVEIFRTNNFLARLPGTERPNETIIFSAHWDHVGGEAQHPETPGDDKIFNGAWDNASGTVGLVEMARAFKAAPRPERSVVFAHMAAEEMGLLGGYWYAANPVWPLETTVADINIDMLPLSPPTKDIAIFGYGQNTLEDDLAELAKPHGRYVSDDHMPEEGFYYRSDHFPFARVGVPAIMPWHGWDWDEGGLAAGEAAWREKFGADYHQPSDEWSADLDWRSAVENLELFFELAQDLANNDEWPEWKANSEFKAARDASNAQRR